MLVFSRRPNESMMVGDEIEISVIEVRGNKVRLGIVAPKNVGVHRREIWELIKKGQREEYQPQ